MVTRQEEAKYSEHSRSMDLRMPPPICKPPKKRSRMSDCIAATSQYWLTELNNSLNNMRKSGILCDVNIQTASGEMLRAHSSILAAASPHLQTKFGELEQGVYTLKTNNIDFCIWECILEFMYVGVVKVKRSELESLFNAADGLDLTFLKNFCHTTLNSMRDKGTDDCDIELPFPLVEVKDEPLEVSSVDYNSPQRPASVAGSVVSDMSSVSKKSIIGQDDLKEEGSDIEVPLDLSSKSNCSTPSLNGSSSHHSSNLPLVISEFSPPSSLDSSEPPYVRQQHAQREAQLKHNMLQRQWHQQQNETDSRYLPAPRPNTTSTPNNNNNRQPQTPAASQYQAQYVHKQNYRYQQQQQQQQQHQQEKAKQYEAMKRVHAAAAAQREIEEQTPTYVPPPNKVPFSPIIVAPTMVTRPMVKPTHSVQPVSRPMLSPQQYSVNLKEEIAQPPKKRIIGQLHDKMPGMNSLEQLAMVALSTASSYQCPPPGKGIDHLPKTLSLPTVLPHSEHEDQASTCTEYEESLPDTDDSKEEAVRRLLRASISQKSLPPPSPVPIYNMTYNSVSAPQSPQLPRKKMQFSRKTRSEYGGDTDNTEDEHDHEQKRVKCPMCDKTYVGSSHLAVHLRTHTGERPFKCSVCNRGFRQKATLIGHMRTHSGEKPYQCGICGKAFSQSGNKLIHERTHNDHRPWKCEMCGKQFARKETMQIHQKVHTGEKPFKCIVCEKAFTQRANLRVHERIHKGELRFACETCGRRFLRKESKNQHERTHIGERPYTCEVCSKMFTQRGNRVSHMKKHHPEEYEQLMEEDDRCGEYPMSLRGDLEEGENLALTQDDLDVREEVEDEDDYMDGEEDYEEGNLMIAE